MQSMKEEGHCKQSVREKGAWGAVFERNRAMGSSLRGRRVHRNQYVGGVDMRSSL